MPPVWSALETNTVKFTEVKKISQAKAKRYHLRLTRLRESALFMTINQSTVQIHEILTSLELNHPIGICNVNNKIFILHI